MLTFTSDHHRRGRVYRVVDPGDPSGTNDPDDLDRLATCEYLRDGAWRPAKGSNARHIAHCIVHGRPHVSLTERGAARVRAAAAAAVINSGLW